MLDVLWTWIVMLGAAIVVAVTGELVIVLVRRAQKRSCSRCRYSHVDQCRIHGFREPQPYLRTCSRWRRRGAL